MRCVFLFPRDPNKMEGYGFVMLEAQAMGALCAISRGVSEDTIVEKQLVEYMRICRQRNGRKQS
jgi:hypothetical protein